MKYDDWKLETPPSEPENECSFCKVPCDGEYCSKQCKKAYESEN